MDTGSPGKLLVISEIGIGDALTLLPALQSLKSLYPAVRIDMVAPGLFPLRENIGDLVRILDHSRIPVAHNDELYSWLVAQRYRWVWNTQNEKSVRRALFAEFPRRQWISAPPHRDWPQRSVLELRHEHLRRLFPDLSINYDFYLGLRGEQLEKSRAFRLHFPPQQRLIAVQPGAKDVSKIWPPEKYRQLAQLLIKLPSTTVIFFLTEHERKRYDFDIDGAAGNLLLVTESLEALLPKLASCDLFIGNDSGFYHLSYALGLPVIGIFRSRRNKRKWAYRSERSRAVYFYLPSAVRKHWFRFIPVRTLYKACSSLLHFPH